MTTYDTVFGNKVNAYGMSRSVIAHAGERRPLEVKCV